MSNRRSITFVAASSPTPTEAGGAAELETVRLSRLARTIESEIIPRLLVSLTIANRAAASRLGNSCNQEQCDLAALTKYLLCLESVPQEVSLDTESAQPD